MHYQPIESFLFEEEALFLEKKLQQLPWRQVKYFTPARGYVKTPRLSWVAGFHTDNFYELTLSSGQKVTPNPFPSWIYPLKNLVEEKLQFSFNYCLFQLYRDGNDSIAYHSDDEDFVDKTIAILTIGSQRPFILKNKQTGVKESFALKSGDLFVMTDCQKTHLHSLPKIKQDTPPRYSLSFRRVLSEKGSKNYYKFN